MKTYHKAFAVHNTLITYQVWERHQTQGWKTLLGAGTPPAIFDVRETVTDVYYHGVFSTFRRVMETAYKKDSHFFTKKMDEYEAQLEAIQSIIAREQPLPDAASLNTFVQQFQDTWIGLDLSYMPDYVTMDASAERRSAAAREKAFGFYVGADRLIRRTMEKFLPNISALVGYVTLEEFLTKKIPNKAILEARAQHCIYYQGRVITGVSFDDFCHDASIRIESMYAPLQKDIRGLVASGGHARGSVHILTRDAHSNTIKNDGILVAHDLDPQDLPLLKYASAIILDKGSYYGSPAIAARTLKKPCVFETNIATMVLQQGDVLDVNGETGSIRLIK
ncbi:MAG: hypothetical protein RL141_532 [Candidatus Parcubacteria bacterium]|jgi:phosphohistidine swiveling domain-containing protein